jgi:lipopolysaccharide transport system ATP-binding protein
MINNFSPVTNNPSGNDLPDDVVLRVDNVSKKFCRNLKRSMTYGMHDLGRNLFGQRQQTGTVEVEKRKSEALGSNISTVSSKDHSSPRDGLRQDEFWAVKDVSFDLKRGECLGLMGQNGCGKTSLLRLVAGIFPPDRGEISVRGRTGALIALGAGFHPHLSGRENVFLNGSILGIPHREMEGSMDEIIDFAEIPDFIDAPVSSYSSGMRVRLGFAIAACQKPDLLIIDEVLAVGDQGFRIKCLNRIDQMLESSAVIFVSHAIAMVAKICTSILVMDHGREHYKTDNVPQGIEVYNDFFEAPERVLLGSGRAQLHEARLRRAEAEDAGIDGGCEILLGDDVELALRFSVDPTVRCFTVGVAVLDRSGNIVSSIGPRIGNSGGIWENTSDIYSCKVAFSNVFAPGLYSMSVAISAANPEQVFATGEVLVMSQHALQFRSTGSQIVTRCPIQLPATWQLEENTPRCTAVKERYRKV